MGRPYRVLLTRADNRRTRELLEDAGVAVVEVPLVAFEATHIELPEVGPEDVVAYTSVNGVVFGGALAQAAGTVAAVGPSTARALEEAGRSADIVPQRALGHALAEALGPSITGRRVWLPRAEVVPPGLVQRLGDLGADPVPIPVYRNVLPAGAAAALAGLEPIDAIAFASGSAAHHFLVAGGRLGRMLVVVIGPSTARACVDLGLEVASVADPHTADGLAAAVLGALRRSRGG